MCDRTAKLGIGPAEGDKVAMNYVLCGDFQTIFFQVFTESDILSRKKKEKMQCSAVHFGHHHAFTNYCDDVWNMVSCSNKCCRYWCAHCLLLLLYHTYCGIHYIKCGLVDQSLVKSVNKLQILQESIITSL